MGYIITRNHTYIRVKEDGKKYYNSDEKEKARNLLLWKKLEHSWT